jgi:putative acetyltransferase
METMIRLQTHDDDAAIGTVIEGAFGDEGPLIAELVDALRTHPCGRDGLSFVAEVDGSVVGHVMVTRSRLDTNVRIVDVAVLSPLAVDPALHRRGIGSRLVERAVAAATEAGLPAIFVEGDPAYYSRMGFREGKPLRFRKPSLRIPDAAFQVILLPGHEDWMTGTLVYAEPFWDRDCVGLREPEFLAWLAEHPSYGLGSTIDRPFDEVVADVRRALAEQGFGIVSEIDMQQTLKNKLGVDIDRQLILGACNPGFAHQALQVEPSIGLLLPCNVVVRRTSDATNVEMINPQAMVDVTGSAPMQELSNEITMRLQAALDSLG